MLIDLWYAVDLYLGGEKDAQRLRCRDGHTHHLKNRK